MKTEDGQIPEDYECVLEAYLKRNGAYVVNRRGEAVSLQIPYLVRCRSYQIGEDLVRRLTFQLKFHVPGETVLPHRIFLPAKPVDTVLKPAHQRKKNRRSGAGSGEAEG